MGSYQPITRVAIIGAGPVGVAFAKYLRAERVFEKIDVFEQRNRVGGVWNYSPAIRSEQIPIPQLNPRYGCHPLDQPVHENHLQTDGFIDSIDDGLEFESPIYDRLETNIPKQVMKFSDTPFADELPLFPHHADVLKYLEDYAADVRHLIQFETQVRDVRLIGKSTSNNRLWQVEIKDLKTEQVTSNIYDAVVASSGHYTVPHVPDINGIAKWNQAYPQSIIHSKAYRNPEIFEGKDVLVVGTSASGLDIGFQIGQFSNKLYLSSRSDSDFGATMSAAWETVDEVAEFLDPAEHDRAVRTKSGRVLERLDRVVFATGYLFSFPYLARLEPPLITDGFRTRDTYHHFLHIEYPELALPVLNLRILPFGLAENQAAVVARLWSCRLPMPSKTSMRAWEQEELQRKGQGKYFHIKKFPEEALQMNELYRWAASARTAPGLENNGQGKLGMMWDERAVWLRSKFPALKAAYAAKGDARLMLRNIEELGFIFEDWIKTATDQDREMFRQAKCPPAS